MFELLPFLLILVFFYLVIIRPSRARQREAVRLQDQLGPGQKVMTTSGLFATVVGVEDDAIVLETAPGQTSRWVRAAVAKVIDPVEPEVEATGAERSDDAARGGDDDRGFNR